MKKKALAALALALALILSCGSGALAARDPERITVEAIAAANSRETLLAAHVSTLLVLENYGWDDVTVYSAQEYSYYLGDEEILYDTAGVWYLINDDSGRFIRYDWYAVAEDPAIGELYLTLDPVFNMTTLLTDTIEAVRDNGDGTLTVTLAGPEGGFTQLLESIDAADPDVPADAREMIDVVLDAETLEIRSTEDYGLRTDGERVVVSRSVVTVDAPEPENVTEIRAATAAFRAGAPAQPRTVTMVYDAGTDFEQRYSITADRSFMVHPITYYGYDLWYTDAERMQVFSGTDGLGDVTVYAFAPGAYLYEHDPRLNAAAMADVVADDDAVYGFRPSETGSLAMYADADWTDPEMVAAGRAERVAYHESLESMYELMEELQTQGADIETVARAVSTRRNELRLEAYADDPEGLAAIKARNLEKYGHEEGPLPDEMFEKYGSWETVLAKAFSANSGMDACLGLYDDYYDVYVASGWVQLEAATFAQRQYAVALFVDAIDPWLEDTEEQLGGFADASEISDLFRPQWEWAVENGLVRGYEDGTLRPKQTISRVEAFVLLSRCLPELEAVGEPLDFTDVPDWAKADVDRLSAAGLVLGYGDGTLGAEDALTVEQLYEVLGRAAA